MLTTLPVETVHLPAVPLRAQVDEEALRALTQSVARDGLLTPLLVRRRAAGGYEVISGSRRLEAARRAALTHVPAEVRAAGDAEALILALSCDRHSAPLDPIDQGRAYLRLAEQYGLKQAQIAERLQIHPTRVSKLIALLGLPADVQETARTLPISRVEILAPLVSDPEAARRLARKAAAGVPVPELRAERAREQKPRADTPAEVLRAFVALLEGRETVRREEWAALVERAQPFLKQR